jgi:hypothetical protein
MQSAEINLERLIRLALEIEDETSLNEPSHLRQRIELLDRLEAYLFQSSLPALNISRHEPAICARAKAIQAKLEAVNFEVYAAIRREIRCDRGRSGLLHWLPSLAAETAGGAASKSPP